MTHHGVFNSIDVGNRPYFPRGQTEMPLDAMIIKYYFFSAELVLLVRGKRQHFLFPLCRRHRVIEEINKKSTASSVFLVFMFWMYFWLSYFTQLLFAFGENLFESLDLFWFCLSSKITIVFWIEEQIQFEMNENRSISIVSK